MSIREETFTQPISMTFRKNRRTPRTDPETSLKLREETILLVFLGAGTLPSPETQLVLFLSSMIKIPKAK